MSGNSQVAPIHPGDRFINEGLLGGFVYNIVQANEQQVMALIYPFGLARDKATRGEQVEFSPDIFQKFRKISRKEARPYETGEII